MALPTLIFEVGFTAGPSTGLYLHLNDTARGLLDTNTLAPDNVLQDVASFVHEFTTARSSNRVAGPVLRYEAGSLSAELNNTDRRFDPTNLAGPYVSAGVTQVTPMRLVQVRATWAGTTYNVWRGNADSWLPGYLKGDAYASVSLDATDGFKILGNYNRPPVSAVGTSELTGARVSRILDSAAWPVKDRMVGLGQTTFQATTLEGDSLAELQLVTDTEIGEFYIDNAGRATFRDRYAVLTETRSNTSQATFGDDLSGGELPYYGIDPSYDDEQMVNLTRITRVGGAEQVAQDATSIQNFLTHAYERSDLLMQSDTVAASHGSFIVYLSKDPEYRFEALTINPLTDPANLFPQVLGREIGDRITVRRRPPGGGVLIEREVLIRGIAHEVSFRDATWMTTWQLQSTTKFSFLTLNHATLGQLNNNALGY